MPVDFVTRVALGGNWLADQHLVACLACPEKPTEGVLLGDESRPRAVDLATQLLDPVGQAQSRLQTWAQGQSALVAFPELAFGSPDFGALDALVEQYPAPLILLAGFGFARGEALRNALANTKVEPSWSPGDFAIDDDGRYNGAWCWVHRPGVNTRSFLVLKNFPEQTIEVAGVPGLTPGRFILRLDTDNLVLFPLICADLICQNPTGPRMRVIQSLQSDPPSAGSEVLVPSLLFTNKPADSRWQAAMDELVSVQVGGRRRIILLLSNLEIVPPVLAEDQDQWRSLSGAYIHRGIMSTKPTRALPTVRFVQSVSTSGLLLRQPAVGTSCGTLSWVHDPALGRNVWLPNRCHSWTQGALSSSLISSDAAELQRAWVRWQEVVLNDVNQELRGCVAEAVDSFGGQFLPADEAASRVFLDTILAGLREGRERSGLSDPDAIHKRPNAVMAGLVVFSVLRRSLGADVTVYDHLVVLQHKLVHNGDQDLSDVHILVWKDPDYGNARVFRRAEDLVRGSGSAPPLFLVAGGQSGDPKPAGRVHQGRLATNAPDPAARDIRTPRPRVVHWRPISRFEEVLAQVDVEADLKARISAELFG